MALRQVFASTANFPAASETSAPAADASAVLSTAKPAHNPYPRSVRWSQWPMRGNVNNEIAPRANIAAIAYDESSSSASIAPCVAIIAETPHMDDPTASSVMSLGLSLKALPITVMNASESVISMKTRASEMPPSLSTSPMRNLAPRRTMPALSQNSYVATPARKIAGMPMVLEMIRPLRMAQ